MHSTHSNSQLSNKFYVTILILLSTITIFNVYAIAQNKAAPAAAPEKDKHKSLETEVNGWQIKDYLPYIQAMNDISKLSREYSENMLQLAIDEYSAGIDKLEKMEAEIARLEENNKNKINPGEKRWQSIDRENQEKRQIYRIKQNAKMKSGTYFALSINHLDEIQSKSILESKEFVIFKVRLYQVFVSTQYDLQNFNSCIPVLEKYISLNNDTQKDLWAHKYLANCYAFMESLSQKSRSIPKEDALRYGHLKNKYLLKASEIQYGVESPEYKNMQDIINKYEKISIKSVPKNPEKK